MANDTDFDFGAPTGTAADATHIYEPAFTAVLPSFAALEPADGASDGPVDDSIPYALLGPGDKARSLIGNKDQYKQFPAQRSASLAFASLEQAEAVDRQTAAIDRQTAILELQLAVSERLLAEQRMQNQLRFFGMMPSDFEPKRAVEPPQVEGEPAREATHTQMKRNLGISAPRPTVAVAEEPAPAEGNAPEPEDDHFS